MTQHILEIDRNSSGIGTEVNKHAAGALLGIGKYRVGECQRSEIHLSNGDIGQVKALVEIAVEHLAPENVQEVSFQAAALDAHGIHLILVVHLVFLCGGIKNLLVLVTHIAVTVHQFVDHFLCNDGVFGEIFHNIVFHTANALSSHTDIDVYDFRLQCSG